MKIKAAVEQHVLHKGKLVHKCSQERTIQVAVKKPGTGLISWTGGIATVNKVNDKWLWVQKLPDNWRREARP